MSPNLTYWERQLATVLPCTTARIAAWYSRWWRSPDRRDEAVFQSITVLIVTLIFAGGAAMLRPASDPLPVPESSQWPAIVLALILGIGAGHNALHQTVSRLDGHWLAWCLEDRQRIRELAGAGLRLGLGGVLGVVGLCLILSYWFVLSILDMAIVAGLFAIGFLISFILPRPRRARTSLISNAKSRSRVAVPAALLLQASRPRPLLTCVVLTLLAVSAVASWAVHQKAGNVLGLALLVAVIGFAFCQSLLVPAAATLHALLAWTGVPLWRSVARLLVPPVTLAFMLICPVVGSALILRDPTLLVMSLLGPVAASYVTAVWIVGDLARLRGGHSQAFVLAHTLLPIAALASGPVAVLFFPLHLAWLLRRGRQLWGNEA